MKFRILAVLAVCVLFAVPAVSQSSQEESEHNRPRVIVTENVPKASPKPEPKKIIVVNDEEPVEVSNKAAERTADAGNEGPRVLSFGEIRQKLEEAKRQMRTKPLRISMTDEDQTTEVVRLAFLDWSSNELDYVVLSKQEFLSKDTQSIHKSESGNTVRIQTIRGNGVNTPVLIYDMNNQAQLPLIVQYPRDNKGKFVENGF